MRRTTVSSSPANRRSCGSGHRGAPPVGRRPAGSTAIAQEYAGQVNVVGVGGLADATDIRDFARQVEGPTHLIDEDGEIWRHFNVTAQSTYVILDADGGVVSEGYLDDDDALRPGGRARGLTC